MADVFDVISDPTRRDLLGRLLAQRLANGSSDGTRGGELSVGALVEQTGLSQPTVSKHLKVLRDFGLVAVRDEAQHRYYRLDPRPLVEVEEWLAPFVLSERHAVAGDAAEAQTPLIAWSGAGVGESLGRMAADSAHRVQAALHRLEDATERAKEALDRFGLLP